MTRKVKELDPYIKARVGEALLKLEGLIKPSNLTAQVDYITQTMGKRCYDNYTNKQQKQSLKK